MTPRSSGLPLVSLYSGAGGMDYGFEAAGFEVRAALEMDADACETMRLNGVKGIIDEPIEEVTSKRLLKTAGCRRREVAALIGGPPCQPFSKSGYWSRGDTLRLADPRARTLDEFMRCVEDLLPQVFVIENVYGIGYEGKAEGLELIERLTSDINARQKTKYRLARKVLNAAAFGVPQLRERFFLVAHRDGGLFEFPHPTHRVADVAPSTLLPEDDEGSLQDAATAWDAIGHLQPPHDEDLKVRGRWADLLPSIPEGENYLWHTNRKGGLPLFGWRTRYWSFLLKLSKRLPSWTIQAQPGPAVGPFHWENRRLSVAEMAAIQTFPAMTRFFGSRVSVQKQIGNAVPSLLAEVVGRAISEQFFAKVYEAGPSLAVEPKRPIPPAARLQTVPKKFLALQGAHQDYVPAPRARSRRSNASTPELF